MSGKNKQLEKKKKRWWEVMGLQRGFSTVTITSLLNQIELLRKDITSIMQ